MKTRIGWGSHLPVLIKVMSITNGSVLELGSGYYSTPYLHWHCFNNKRELVTYEIESKYYKIFRKYDCDYHKVIYVNDWNDGDIERKWDVALIDHSPMDRRKIDIERLSNYVKYIIVHDTDLKVERYYHYKDIYPLFKYKWKYRGVKPHTTILSNIVSLKEFKL